MPVTEQDDIRAFLEYLQFQKRYSPHTLLSYSNDLGAFFDFLEVQYQCKELAVIEGTFVRSWLADMKQRGFESRTINRKISALKSFFKFHLRQGKISKSPMATIVTPKVKKRLPQFVEEKDIVRLFQDVPFPQGWQGQTERLVLELFYHTGMRQAELTGLQERQADISNQAIKVLGKGNKERIIPVQPELMRRVAAYIEAKRHLPILVNCESLLVDKAGQPLKPRSVYTIVNKYLRLVTTIDKKSPHVLRHTFATHLMNNGAELNAVKDLLGHASLAATQVYTHNTIEKLKTIYQKAHPKA